MLSFEFGLCALFQPSKDGHAVELAEQDRQLSWAYEERGDLESIVNDLRRLISSHHHAHLR